MATTPRPRSGSWRVEWRLPGGRFQGVTFPDEDMAWAAKVLAELRGHRITDDEVYRVILDADLQPSACPTLAEWIAQWLKRKVDVQPDTKARYASNLAAYVIPRLGHLRLDQIDQEVITDWVSWMTARTHRRHRAKNLSATTVRKAHAVLHQVLGAAVPRWIPANPAAKPAGSRRGNTGLPRHQKYDATFLTFDEARLIRGHVGPAIADLVEVALFTGLRLGELLVLRVEDVDLAAAEPCVYVRRALKDDGTIGDPKSPKSRRAVTVSTALAALLARLIEGKPRWALLFPSPTGVIWDKDNLRERHWKPAVVAAQRCSQHPPAGGAREVAHGELCGERCGDNGGLRSNGKRCGARVTPGIDRCGSHVDPPKDAVSTCACPGRLHKVPRFHDLRHTQAAWLIAAGWDIYVISRRLGHESISTTMDIYGHLLPQGQQGGLDGLDRMAA